MGLLPDAESGSLPSMSRLADGLARLFGRVEILARGVDDLRRSAAQALARGRVLEARAQARALLTRVPRSPVGLALWADSSQRAGLDAEVVAALSQLTEEVPWQQELWLRLGMAGLQTGWDGARQALERASGVGGEAELARRALLMLCDLDLKAGQERRALRWLDRIVSRAGETDVEVAVRRAECLLRAGETSQAKEVAASLGEPYRADGRDRLVLARTAASQGEPRSTARAVELALGAYILEAEGSASLLAQLVAASHGSEGGCADALDRVRRVLEAQGCREEPQWRAALAMAEGRVEEARAMLLQLLAGGQRDAAATLMALATQTRDVEALLAVAQREPSWITAGYERLLEGVRLHRQGQDREALERFEAAAGSEAGEWAATLVEEVLWGWVPPLEAGTPTQWTDVLGALRDAARALDRLDLVKAIEALAIEGERPLRVALVGEFNAGKSTLLNALLGIDVAPTGVRPTTACLHWVAWAPDPFARIVVRGGADRVVGHGELKPTLDQLRAASHLVERVYIYAPIERLKRIELLDTPGFNAPHGDHEQVAEAGVRESHLALWLLDATVPLKNTERRAIERFVAAGVPVQVLVNKRDRVPAGRLPEVMQYVRGALESAVIVSYRPPVALSARQALQGRLGDPQTLAQSNWDELERLVADDIVNRCDELRELALRRRAAQISADLGETAGVRSRRYEAELAEHRRRAAGLRQLAARLESERTGLVTVVMTSMRQALTELDADARPIEQLSARRSRADAELRDYLVDRTVARLVPALADAIAEAAVGQEASLDLPRRTVRELVIGPVGDTMAGAAAAHRSGVVLSRGALRDVIDLTLRTSARVLRSAAAAPPPKPAFEIVPWRLNALARALGRGA